jgi:hypothetical protein
MRLLRTRKTPPDQSPGASHGEDWVDREIGSLRELIREELSRRDQCQSVDAPPLPQGSESSRTRRSGRGRTRRRGLAQVMSKAGRSVRGGSSRIGLYGFALGLALMLGWLASFVVNNLMR